MELRPRHWDNGERRKLSSLTTIVWSFEDFFRIFNGDTYWGVNGGLGKEPWSIAGKWFGWVLIDIWSFVFWSWDSHFTTSCTDLCCAQHNKTNLLSLVKMRQFRRIYWEKIAKWDRFNENEMREEKIKIREIIIQLMLEFWSNVIQIGEYWSGVHIHFWQTNNWSGSDNGPGGIVCVNWDV